MDPVATVSSILDIIYELKRASEQVKSNRIACKKLSERFAYLSTVLRRPDLASRTDTFLIAQRIENFSLEVLAFMQKLLPTAPKAPAAKRGVLGAVKKGFTSVARICKEVAGSIEVAGVIGDYQLMLNQLLQDLMSIL
ncbi:hypothetical protein EON64_17045 [archaeon]|nr:MAG: hypothetical protein EON64_17045 [archaeon]